MGTAADLTKPRPEGLWLAQPAGVDLPPDCFLGACWPRCRPMQERKRRVEVERRQEEIQKEISFLRLQLKRLGAK